MYLTLHYANKYIESTAMSARLILGLEQVPRVWLFAN